MPQTPIKREDEIDKRANEMFNSHPDLQEHERAAGEASSNQAGVDQAEAYANDPENASSKNIDDTKGKEEAGQGLYRPGPKKSEQKETVNLKTIIKKKGPLVGIVVALLGAGGILTTLLSPALLVVQLSEMMTERYNDQLAALDLRSTALLKKKLGKTTTKGVCGKTITIGCKYQTFGEKQLNRLKKAGITPIPDEPNRPFGRYKPTHFVFEGRRIAAGDLLNEARKSPGLRSALRHGYNPKFAGFSDKISAKVRAKVGIRKASDVKPGSEEKMKEDLKKVSSGEVDGVGKNKLKPVYGEDGKTIVGYEDENGKPYSVSDGRRINNLIDEIDARNDLSKIASKDALKRGIKSALTTTALGAGAVDSVCTAWIMVRVAGFAAKVYQQRQLIRYAFEFMKFGNKVKASAVSNTADQPTPEEAEFFGDILTNPNSEGKTATDSNGYKFAAYGDAFKTGKYSAAMNVDPKGSDEEKDKAAEELSIENETARYVNGQVLPNNIMSELMRYVTGSGNSKVSAVDDTCGFVKSWKGQALVIGLAVVGLAIGIFTGGTSIGVGAALQVGVSVALSVAFALLMPKLLAMAKGEVITGNENGNEAGNAIASGAGGLNAQASRTRGLAPMAKDDFTKYDDITTTVVANHAEIERYEHSPFDTTSKHTFLGSIVSSMLPHLANTKTTGTSILGFSSLVSSSLSSIVSPKSSALQSSKEMYDQCDDPEYDEWNLAADPFCNERGGITPSTLNIDPDTVLEFMEKKDSAGKFIYIESNEVEEGKVPIPKGEYKKYIAKCFDRETSFGDSFNDYTTGEDTGSNKDSGEECVDGRGGKHEYRNDIFRLFYVDTGVQDGMDSEFEVGGVGAGDESTESGDGTINFATYNVRTSTLNNKDFGDPDSVYDGDDDQRMQGAANIITSKGIQIVAVQEARGPERAGLLKHLPENFSATNLSMGKNDFSDVVFWDNQLYEEVKSGTFTIPKQGSTIRDSVWVQLRSKEFGGEVFVFNIHPSLNESEREVGARKTLEEVKKIVPSGTPYIIAGDMNSNDSDPGRNAVFEVFKESGTLTYTRTAVDSPKGDNCDTQNSPGDGRQDCRQGRGSHIDQVWVSKDPKVVTNSYENLATAEALKISDHNPVITKLTVPGFGGESSGELGWMWPIKPAESKPGPCFSPGSHAGLDINSDSNSDVLAAHNGVVEIVSSGSDSGNYVMIKADSGLYYAYQHLVTGSVKVKKGQTVGKGSVIAQMGLTGNVHVSSSKAHLHVTISNKATLGSRSNTTDMIDPMKYLSNSKPSNYNCY